MPDKNLFSVEPIYTKYEAGEGDYPADFNNLSEEDKARVIEWIKTNMRAKQRFGESDSYALKHVLERDIGLYVTNGQFKGAMLMCGHTPQDEKELNWTFRVRTTPEVRRRVYGPVNGD